MNLQKELVSQEILIDERLKSGDYKKALLRTYLGSQISSTATCEKALGSFDYYFTTDTNREDSPGEHEYQVEKRHTLDNSSAPDVHFISDADTNDSLNENASQDEDRKRLKRSAEPDQNGSSMETAQLVQDRKKQMRSSAQDEVNADLPIFLGLSASTDVVNADPPILRSLSASTESTSARENFEQIFRAGNNTYSYMTSPIPNRSPIFSKDAEQMSVDSQKINQGQPLVWVPPPPPDPPNPHQK